MIIAGTGHRPDKLGGYGEITAKKALDVASQYLEQNKPDVVISGMALGWDQALAVAAIMQKIEIWAYIPFMGQEAVWPPKAKELYAWIHDHCNYVHFVCDPGYAAWKMQKRNELMVDHADRVVALWNGTSGGTANCIAYAQKKHKPIINLWDEYAKIHKQQQPGAWPLHRVV